MHVELARIKEAKKIILAQRSPKRFEMAKKFRADIFINPNEEGLKERVIAEDGKLLNIVVLP